MGWRLLGGAAALVVIAGACGRSAMNLDGPLADTEGCLAGSVTCGGVCVDTSANASHCGACGFACGEGEVCSQGVCRSECEDGLEVCDGGCVDTATDAESCGACDNACPDADNATAACEDATCGYVCDQGYGDCNESGDDGCETDVTASVDHCGACGEPCPDVANGTVTCQSSACAIDSCDGDFDDCDGQLDNGCETDLTSSAAHCGACGNGCSGNTPVCSGGQCVPHTSCLEIKKANPGATSGVYTIDPDGKGAFQVHCDMTSDGGGWTLLAKVSGGDVFESWGWNGAVWKNATAFNNACVLNTASGCDGKSAAWGSLAVAQLQVDTGYGTARYNLVNAPFTLAQKFAAHNFVPPSSGVVIGNRYASDNPGASQHFQVLSMGDGDANNGQPDRCMLHVRWSTSQAYTSNANQGYCAGRIRSPYNATSFVYWPQTVNNLQRADYARMNDGTSQTLGGTMIIYGR